MPTTIDWPDALRPATVDWGLILPQRLGRSTFDGSAQAASFGVPRWAFTISTGPIKRDEVAAWEAFVDQLDGAVNRVRAWDWRRETPLGVATGTPTVRVSALGIALETEGWTANVTGILRAGAWLGVNGELKRLSLTANSDALGRAQLVFRPPLRVAPSVGMAITLVKPKAVFVMTTPRPSFLQEGVRVRGATLAFEEEP